MEPLATNALSDEAFGALSGALSYVGDEEEFELDLVVIAPPSSYLPWSQVKLPTEPIRLV